MDNKEQVTDLILSIMCNNNFKELYDGEFEDWITGESELSELDIWKKIKDILPCRWEGLYTNK